MLEQLTWEAVIAAIALGLSFYTYRHGRRIAERLLQIEQARFESERAAQTSAGFHIQASKAGPLSQPLYGVGPPQQLHGVGPPQQPYGVGAPQQPYSVGPPQQPPYPVPILYRYTFYIQNVGETAANDLSIEVRALDESTLYRAGTLELLEITWWCTFTVDLPDFPALKLVLKWKDRAHQTGTMNATDPFWFHGTAAPS